MEQATIKRLEMCETDEERSDFHTGYEFGLDWCFDRPKMSRAIARGEIQAFIPDLARGDEMAADTMYDGALCAIQEVKK